MDELRNGGRSVVEVTAAARTRPAASARTTSSAGSGSARSRTRESASATVRRGLTVARYTSRTGYPRGVISVVIPVHDEERSVALLYDELAAAFGGEARAWEAVFVDDGSTDGTFGALTQLHDAHDNVRVVRLRRNFGKAATPPRSLGCSPAWTRASTSSPAGRRTGATRSRAASRHGSSTWSRGGFRASGCTT